MKIAAFAATIVVMVRIAIEVWRIKASGGKQNFQWHIATRGFHEAVAVNVLIESRTDASDVDATHKVGLVQDTHAGEGDLAEFQLHYGLAAWASAPRRSSEPLRGGFLS